jgi:hypothetical protein
MPGFTTVSATHVRDTTGAVIANATIKFQPCDAQGRMTSYRVGGGNGGQSSFQPVSTQVRAGVFSIQLADTTLTLPPNIAFAVTVIDNATGNILLGPKGYLIQPSGEDWDFDAFTPSTGSAAVSNT